MRKSFLAIWGALLLLSCGKPVEDKDVYVPFAEVPLAWADSIAQTLSLEEKIRQLIILRPQAPSVEDSILPNVRVGGLWLSQWPEQAFRNYVRLAHSAPSLLPPLLLAEPLTALNNQFSDVPRYPKPASIRSINNFDLKEKLKMQRLEQYRQYGITAGLFPFARMLGQEDHHLFPRDFAAEIEESRNYLQILIANRILPLAEGLDPWRLRPSMNTSLQRDSLNLLLHSLVREGLSGLIRKGEKQLAERPAEAVSRRLYLRDTLMFEGLLIDTYPPKNSLQQLLNSGVDAFIVSDSAALKQLCRQWKEALENGLVLPARLEESLLRMLRARRWTNRRTATSIPNDLPEQERPRHEQISRMLYQQTPILLQNPQQMLPFHDPARFYQLLVAGATGLKSFRREIGRYAQFRSRRLNPESDGRLRAMPVSRYRDQHLIIVLGESLLSPEQREELIQSINELSAQSEVAVVNFGDPAPLVRLRKNIGILQVFEQNDWTEEAAARILFGGQEAGATLPYSLSDSLPRGSGAISPKIRLSDGEPEDVGIASHKLTAIDAIVGQAIRKKAFPGAQVLVAKHGRIIYHKSFGYHTYEKKRDVQLTDVYDLASITKVAATTLLAMEARENQQLKLTDRLEEHLPQAAGKPIGKVRLGDLLTHYSGIQPNMPIVPYLLHRNPRRDSFCNTWFCTTEKAPYGIPIGENLYFNEQELDSIWQKVFDLKAGKRRRQRYSDVNLILIQKLLEKKTGKSLEETLYARFFYPLGLRRLRYRPLEHFKKDEIVPTQLDRRWRQQLVQGYVHDETAALLGGVAGNAGLFGNAEDLAILFQMLLQGGSYGGRSYLSAETIEQFTTAPGGSERAYGFEKPWSQSKSSCSSVASPSTYGHTGFTGTSVWVDPEAELIFIFLSNRIHPDSRNWKINQLDVRRRIHNAIYDALDSQPAPQFLQDIPLVEKDAPQSDTDTD